MENFLQAGIMIEVTNLEKSFGNVTVLKNLTFTIEKGEVFGVVGHSGQENQPCFVASMPLKGTRKAA